MSESYSHVYRTLGLPASILAIVGGRIRLPSAGLRVPFADFGYPPALIPFWSMGTPMYNGLWKHWFATRSSSYVTFSIEFGYFAWEIGRSPAQLLTDIVSQFIGYKSSIEQVRCFAADVGVDAEQVMACRSKGGAYRYDLLRLLQYASDPPRSSLRSAQGYRGDFPDWRHAPSFDILRTCCTTEFDEDARQRIASDPAAPEWFRSANQKPLFERYVKEGELQSAWMSLNSHGWSYSDAKQAMAALAERASDPLFSAVTVAWCSRPHERFGRY